MSQAAAICCCAASFHLIEKIERGFHLYAGGVSAYSGIAVKDLLEVVIPGGRLKHRRQRQNRSI